MLRSIVIKVAGSLSVRRDARHTGFGRPGAAINV